MYGLYGAYKAERMAICQEANNVIRRRAILDITTFAEQNMCLKPMTAILNSGEQKHKWAYNGKNIGHKNNAADKPQRQPYININKINIIYIINLKYNNHCAKIKSAKQNFIFFTLRGVYFYFGKNTCSNSSHLESVEILFGDKWAMCFSCVARLWVTHFYIPYVH